MKKKTSEKPVYRRPSLSDFLISWGHPLSHKRKNVDRLIPFLPDPYDTKNMNVREDSVSSLLDGEINDPASISSLTNGNLKTNAVKSDRTEYVYQYAAFSDDLSKALLQDKVIHYKDGEEKTYLLSMLGNIKKEVTNPLCPLSHNSRLFTDHLPLLIKKAEDCGEAGNIFLRIADKAEYLAKASESDDTRFSEDCITYSFFLLMLSSLFYNETLAGELSAYFEDEKTDSIIKNGIDGTFYTDSIITEEDSIYKKIRNISENISEKDLKDIYEIVSASSTSKSADIFLEKVMSYFDECKNDPKGRFMTEIDGIVDVICKYNAKYSIIGNLWSRIKAFPENKEANEDIKKYIAGLGRDILIRNGIATQGTINLMPVILQKKEINILLPSVSERVGDYLSGINWALISDNSDIHINFYISECRPKSNNVEETLRVLHTHIRPASPSVRIIASPDNTILSLLCRGRIDLVLYGSSRVLMKDEKTPAWITNSCGTAAVLLMAREKNVPVHIIAEHEKWQKVRTDGKKMHFRMRYEDMPVSFIPEVRESEFSYETMISKHDFCELHPGIIIVNESESVPITEVSPPIEVAEI